MDEENETLPNHLFISLRYELTVTRVVDQHLSPTTIKIKTDVSSNASEDSEYDNKMETALSKIEHLVHQVLNHSVIFSAENEWALESFMGENSPRTSNNVILTPEEPTDACLAELILSKFRAVTGEAFMYHAIDIESSDSRGMGFTFVGEPGTTFPQGEDWLTNHNYFSKPWWMRGDASTMDVVPSEEDDLNSPPSWAYSFSFIANEVAEKSNIPPKAIVRPEFRPRVIEGGKVD